MSDIDFFRDGEPVEEALKKTARRLNAQLNQKLRITIDKLIGNLLCECVDKGDDDGFKLLLTRYPNQINARDHDKDTPLIVAANMDRGEIVKFLLQYPDVDINAINAEGMTAVMQACEHDHRDIGKILLSRPDLDITIRDEDGDTALTLAVQSENSELVHLILERDEADVEQKDDDGESARSIAEAFKGGTSDQREILKLIKDHKSYKQKTMSKQAKEAAMEVGERQRRQNAESIEPDKADETLSPKALAAKYPYPHSLALFAWMKKNRYAGIVFLTGKILHGSTKLRTPTLLKFVADENAIYLDASRKSYAPEALSICRHIGYNPATDYPLAPKSVAATKPPETGL